MNTRVDLAEAKSFKKASEKELEKLMIELHSSQLHLQKLKATQAHTNNNSSYTSYATSLMANTPNSSLVNSSSSNDDQTIDLIQKKLTDELHRRFGPDNSNYNLILIQEELSAHKKDSLDLKEQIVNLTSEVYGARLAAKYLDKELSGRIQQIQLFGKNLKPDQHELLWNQLEGEIHLHRHKTVIKACRSKRKKNILNSEESQTSGNSKSNLESDGRPISSTPLKGKKPQQIIHNHDLTELRKAEMFGEVRVVRLKGSDSGNEGLGISITGGREHGVPILISEIHENGPAARSGKLFIGDAIISVNDIDLNEALHSKAVETLSNLSGEVKFEVIFAATDEDSESESNDYPYLDQNDETTDVTTDLKSSTKLINTQNESTSNNIQLPDATGISEQNDHTNNNSQ